MNVADDVCKTCGDSLEAQVIVVLGTEHNLRGTCSCDRKREAIKAARNPGALLRIVREQSRISEEFADATLASHPHVTTDKNGNVVRLAQKAGEWYLSKMPNPFDLFVAARDWHDATSDDRAYLRKWQVDAMRGAPSWYIWGEPGRGKSGLASAILNAMRARGIPSLAWNVRLLMDETKNRYGNKRAGNASALWSPLHDTPLLLLDDLDKARASSEDELGHLYSLAEARIAAKLPTIITANASLDDLSNTFAQTHDNLGRSIIDRFAASMLRPLELEWPESFRKI